MLKIQSGKFEVRGTNFLFNVIFRISYLVPQKITLLGALVGKFL